MDKEKLFSIPLPINGQLKSSQPFPRLATNKVVNRHLKTFVIFFGYIRLSKGLYFKYTDRLFNVCIYIPIYGSKLTFSILCVSFYSSLNNQRDTIFDACMRVCNIVTISLQEMACKTFPQISTVY